MKKGFSLFPLFLFIVWPGWAQMETPFTARNALYLEAAGTGLFLSLNYERLLYRREAFGAGLRAGVMTDPTSFFNPNWNNQVGLPLEALSLFGRRRHHLETGLGFTPRVTFNVFKSSERDGNQLIVERGNKVDFIVFGRLGYRYQRPEGGLLFRAGVTPAIYESGDPNRGLKFAFFGGLSVGKSF